MIKEKTYKAFISYSHADKKFGEWLHRALEKYKIPEELRKDYPNLPKSLFPLFRDREELSTSADLGTEILKALHHSEYLIIICSINSAKSQWVNQEIIDFKRIYGEDKVHAIIINGEPHAKESDKFDDDLECFPEALKYKVIDGKLSNIPTEPIAGDFRKGKDGKEYGKLKLISGLLGVKFDELNRREEKRKRRNRFIWGVVSISLIVVMAGLTIFSFKQMKIAELSEQEIQKQLTIIEKRTKSLHILTRKTIDVLISTKDEKMLGFYLKNVLNSGEREVFIEMLQTLIKETESMDEEERRYWFDLLPSMTNKQIFKLAKILLVESKKLYSLEIKYQKDIKKLNEKHLQEWVNFGKRSCIQKKKEEACLDVIDTAINYSYVLDKNESIEYFFNLYKKMIHTPSANYYNVYGLYLVKQKEKNKAINYFKKAVEKEPKNIEFLENLIKVYWNDRDKKKALNLQKQVVFLESQEFEKIKRNKMTLNKDINRSSKRYKKFQIYKNKKITLPIKLLKSLNKLFKLENAIEPNILVNEAYPRYKIFINSMRKKALSLENLGVIDFRYLQVNDNNQNKINSLNESSQNNKKEILIAYVNIEKSLSYSYATQNDYNNSVNSLKRLLIVYNKGIIKLKESWISGVYLSLSWYELILKNYKQSIKYSKKAISLDINGKMMYETNLAHAYLLSGNFTKAKKIYLKNIGKKFDNKSLWENVIKEDFKTLRKKEINDIDFQKIENILNKTQ